MPAYLKKYPFSILIILVVIFLSFFRPPKTSLDTIPDFDKIVHVGMYFVLAGCLWIEYIRSHKYTFTLKHVLIGAFLLPLVFSGSIELLQEYCTTYRGGDWLDFASNSSGIILAALFGYYIVRPRIK